MMQTVTTASEALPSPSPSPKFQITAGGDRTHLPLAAALQASSFADDPAIQYLLHTMPTSKRKAYVPKYITTLLYAGAINGGIFDEAWTTASPAPGSNSSSILDSSSFQTAVQKLGGRADYASAPACAALWLPPGRHVDDWRHFLEAGFLGVLLKIGFGGCKRMLIDFQSKSNAAKRKGLGRTDGKSGLVEYWYLFFISTKAEERGQGLSSAVIRRFQDGVRNEGKGRPIWLESTTEGSRRVYEKLGFVVVDSWVLGKGQVDAKGLKKNGGEGVRIWAMIWRSTEEKIAGQ